MDPAQQKSAALHMDPAQIAEFSQQHGIRKLALFGSALSGHFGPASDVDLLVEFEPGVRVGFFRLAGLEQKLGKLVGRKVDLRTPQDLSRYFRRSVVDGAQVLYERR